MIFIYTLKYKCVYTEYEYKWMDEWMNDHGHHTNRHIHTHTHMWKMDVPCIFIRIEYRYNISM